MKQTNVLIDIKRVSKAFPGVLALDQVDFCLRRGEVHGQMSLDKRSDSSWMNS